MRWTITIEGTDEFGAAHRSEIALEKDLNSLTAGGVGFSIEDGKTISEEKRRHDPACGQLQTPSFSASDHRPCRMVVFRFPLCFCPASNARVSPSA